MNKLEHLRRYWNRHSAGLYDKIGERVVENMDNKGLTVRALALDMTNKGYFNSEYAAREFISRIRNGSVGMIIDPERKSGRHHVEKHLNRLSYILSTIGIEKEDAIVKTIKEDNPDFVY